MARLGYNDIHSRPWIRQVGAANDVTSGQAVRVMAVSIAGGVAAGDVLLHNAVDTAGAASIQVNVLANDHKFLDLGPNGTHFGTALSVAVNGTPDNAVVFYLEDE